jgi:hypothetical protein
MTGTDADDVSRSAGKAACKMAEARMTGQTQRTVKEVQVRRLEKQ